MSSFNKVMLMGNVTRDPQLKQLPSNTTVAEFGLAMNRKFKSAQGEDREETTFVDCTVFGKQAEVLSRYAVKGKPLFIEGRLKFDAWDDRAGGKRSKLTVVVENFQFVGGSTGATRDLGPEFNQPAGRPARGERRPGTGRESLFKDDRPREEHGRARAAETAPLTDADIPF